jgi:molecular chaperone HscC
MPRGATDDAGVEVRFTYDVNGLLQVEATLRKTQQTSSLVIEGNPGLLTEQEIAARLRSLAELKIHPRDTLENRTLMARAERIYQQLRGEVREWLGAQITTFEQALAGQQQRAIASMQRQLEEHLNRIERDGYIMDTD